MRALSLMPFAARPDHVEAVSARNGVDLDAVERIAILAAVEAQR